MIKIQYKLVLLLWIVSTTCLTFSAEEFKKEPRVVLVADIYPPYIYIDDNGKFIGSSVEKIKAIFLKANVTYLIKDLPWKRALQQQKQGTTLMIFPLARFSEREQFYQWIVPLHSLNLKVFGLKGKFDPDNTDITSGKFKFVCSTSTVECTALKANKVSDKSVLTIDSAHDSQMLELVLRGRVNFVVISEAALESNLTDMGIDRNLFVQLENFDYQVDEYLAGSIDVDITLVNKLQRAAKELGFSID